MEIVVRTGIHRAVVCLVWKLLLRGQFGGSPNRGVCTARMYFPDTGELRYAINPNSAPCYATDLTGVRPKNEKAAHHS